MYSIVNFKKLLKSFYRKKTYLLNWQKIFIDNKIELNNKKTFLEDYLHDEKFITGI